MGPGAEAEWAEGGRREMGCGLVPPEGQTGAWPDASWCCPPARAQSRVCCPLNRTVIHIDRRQDNH